MRSVQLCKWESQDQALVATYLGLIVVAEFPERMRALDSMFLHRVLLILAGDTCGGERQLN